MILKTPICALLALFIATAPGTAEPYQTGVVDLAITAKGGNRNTQGFLWYPTQQTEGEDHLHGNAVWQAIPVIPKAEPMPGPHPLVLLSHGLFGNARNQAWLAQALTQKGYMVAAIDHPGTTTFQRDPDQRRALWERPRDVSRTLDQVLKLEGFGAAIDQSRIYMAGHSLGGFTAVALAGGRYDPDWLGRFCPDHADDLACNLFASWGIAQTPAEREMMSRDWSDPRIAGFAVFDLGGTQSFTAQSLAAIDRPMLVIGAPLNLQGLDLDVESRALAAALAPETHSYLEPATLSHFDFLGLCTERGYDILRESEPEDAFVCQEGHHARRADHQIISTAVLDFFAAP